MDFTLRFRVTNSLFLDRFNCANTSLFDETKYEFVLQITVIVTFQRVTNIIRSDDVRMRSIII